MRVLIAALILLFHVPIASAQSVLEVVPERTSQISTREFPLGKGGRSEQVEQLKGQRGSHLIVEYSSDVPFDLRVSYPISSGGENMVYNPMDSVVVELQPTERARVSLDLSASPAWSPWRDFHLMHVIAPTGSEIFVYDVSLEGESLGETVRAFVGQLMIDEPLLLSSINFLWGYRALDVSFSVLLGLFLTCTVVVVIARSSKYQIPNSKKNSNTKFQIVSVCLLCLLLYDARFTFDLARTMAADYRQYFGEGQYRQMGPVQDVATFLKERNRSKHEKMSIAVCTDGEDFLIKQLRYLMYPVEVHGNDAWREATHAVYIDTDRAKIGERTVQCGDGVERIGTVLRTFSQDTKVVRLSES